MLKTLAVLSFENWNTASAKREEAREERGMILGWMDKAAELKKQAD